MFRFRRPLLNAFACVAILATFLAVASVPSIGTAQAGPGENFSLAKADSVDGKALIGEEITYTLTATGDHGSGAALYNLSFRDVLQVGVEFVSADPAPTEVLVDVPGPGQTTVIWSNISDLPANSQAAVDITVDTNPDFAGGASGSGTVPVGSSISNNAEAVASLDAFSVPDYDVVSGAFTADFDGSATASHSVEIIPFRVTKSGNTELLRGVHANGIDGGGATIDSLWTVTVENNPDYAVNSVDLVDVLEPSLEFLGCSDYYPADNTTVGEEWPGSGPVETGTCTGTVYTPTSVDTGATGETIVNWTLGNLAPGQTIDVTYLAGFSLYANQPFSGAPPAAASLGQGRNLDNNTGASTGEPDRVINADPELLSAPESAAANTATATGTYTPTGAAGSDFDTFVSEAEDLALSKSMSGDLNHGEVVTTTLTISTSEYRDFSDLVVRDLLPSGLCFLGTFNADGSGGSDWQSNDCPGAGSVSSTINGTPVNVARVRELPDGGPYGTGRFELVWDFADPSNAALADLDSDGTLTITYSAVVRQYYRGGFASLPGEPVLAGDSVTNEAEVSGPDVVANAAVLPPDPADPDGGIDGDTASDSIDNQIANINKRISVKAGPLANGAGTTGATCATDYASITWAEADPAPELGFGPGDIVCFELNAGFPGNVNYEGATIQDLLPAGYEYIPGSAARIASGDSLAGTTVTESPNVVTFTVGGSGDVGNNGNTFQWVIAADITDNALGAALDINANLEKLVHNNNGGLVFQLRDQTAAEWTEPQVRVAKGVGAVNAAPTAGPDSDGSLTGGSTATVVNGSDAITYRIDVWNTGNTDALNTEIQDVIPTAFTCADISNISDGGTCSAGRITWSALTVAASTGGGDTTPDDETSAPITLTYDLTMPDSVDPSHVYVNDAGAATYQGITNTGPYDYYPTDNIDSANVSLENTDEARDQGYVQTAAPSIDIVQQSGIDEPGNAANATPDTTADQATIGEIVQYQVTVTIPQGTTVYDAEILNTIPTGMTWFTGMGLFGGAVSDLQPTVTSATGDAALTTGVLAEASGDVTYTLPTSYTNVGGSLDDEVTITFYAIVDDVAANSGNPAPTQFSTDASFDWNDVAGDDPAPIVSGTVDTFVVEPNPAIAKTHTVPVGTEVSSGEPITYELTVTNDSSVGNVSVAHDLTIVDTIPAGVTPLDAGGVAVTTDGDFVPSVGITPAGAFFGVWSETNHTITWTSADWIELVGLDPDETLVFSFDAEVDDPAVSSGVLTNVADLTTYSLDQDLLPTADPNSGLARTYQASDDDTLTLPLATVGKDIEPFNAGDPSDDIASFTVGRPVDYQLTVDIPNGTVIYDATQFDALPAGLDFDSFGTITVDPACTIFDATTGTSTGISLTPVDIEQFNPVGADAGLAAWFIGDVYAGGDCTITLEYTAHVNSTTFDTDTVSNDALLTWNATSQVASQTPAALEPGFDSPASASWDNSAGPEAETFTVVEPAIEIDQDVTDVSGTPLADPACDTTPGNNNAGSDDPDGELTDGCDVAAGSQVRYTVTVTSVGTSDAHDVTIVESVPPGVTPLDAPGGTPESTTGATITGSSGSVGVWDEAAHTITWLVAGPLAPAGTATLDYDAAVDSSSELTRGQDITTTVDVSTYYGISEADRTLITTTNPANDDIVVYGNDATATRGTVYPDVNTIEVHFPDLAVAKAAGSGQDATDVRLDTPYVWEIVIENTDPVADAFTVDATDVLPEGWTYDNGSATITTPYNGGPIAVEPTCSASTGACGDAAALNVETLSWTDVISGAAEPLAAGQQVLITFSATPQSAALTSTQAIGEAHTGYSAGAGFAHTNDVAIVGEDATGSAECCDPDGPGGSPAERYGATDDDDAFIARADIEVDKVISPLETDGDPDNGPYWFGSWVNYTITVGNTGPDAATGVQVSDVLDPAELAFDSIVTIDQGTFDDSTNVWDVGAIPAGDDLALTLRTRLVGLGLVTNTAQNTATDQYDSDSTPANGVAAEDDHDEVTIEIVPTALGDFVWLDLNGDGVQDAAEPGIPGVAIELTWVDLATGTPQTFSTTTGADGSYGVPPAAGLPSNTDITVTVDTASPGLIGLAPSFDRDGTLDNAATEQVTAADTTLPGGANADLDFDFGYEPDGTQSFGDKVWWDQDNSADPTDGAGEIPLAAIDVNALWAGWDGLFGTADDLTFTETTNATGDYLFADMPPGEYRVSIDTADLPAGLDIATFDLDGTATSDVAEFTLDPAEDQLDVDFSYTGPGSLGDTVWFDYDGDGAIDAGEPGLGGVTVTALWDGPDGAPGGGDDITLTTITDVDGMYSFENLPYGSFEITVDTSTLPGGMVQTFDADGVLTPNTSTVALDATTPSSDTQDFGFQGAGSIGDTVFFDVDGTETDGIIDAGDAPIVGVDVTIVWAGADGAVGTSDDFTFTAPTDALGNYLVTELPHGDYTVTVDDAGLPAGLATPTFDSDGVATPHTSATTLDASTPDDLDQDFAYTGTGAGQIGDTVWFDQNNDGVQDPTEVGFSGVTVTLVWFGPDGVSGGGDDVSQITVTAADGSYLFDNLPDGNYSVTVETTTLPAGLVQTADADGPASPDTSLVSVSPTEQFNLDQDFGYTGIGSLGDLVWFDVDNSATPTPDAGEPGIGGVDIIVVWTNPQGTDVTYVVTTMPDGSYTLPDLPYGDFTVSVDTASMPGGFTPTFDADGTATPDTATAVLDATLPDALDLDFSYTGVGSLGDTIWFDQDADGALDPAGSGVFDNQDQPLAGVDVAVTWGGFDGLVGDDPGTAGINEAADDLVLPATTDPNGEWVITGLPHGPYDVTVDTSTLPAGITIPTHDADGVATSDVASVTLDAAIPDNLDQDFSYSGAGSVGDTVWFDHNGDGVIDPNEVPLAGVTVTLEFAGPDGTLVTETAVTGLDGMYVFENLPFDVPLTITVDDLTLPAGFVPASDGDGIATPHVSIATLTDALSVDLDQNFGYNGSGSIGDRIWLDRDNSGTPTVDPGDVRMRRIDVQLVWTNPTGAADFTATSTTTVHGRYGFADLPHGSYVVNVDQSTLPAGVTPTFDGDGIATPNTSAVSLDATAPNNLAQDFSYTGNGVIGDTIWTDLNADGIIDAGEAPIEGVQVTLSYKDPISGLPFSETVTTDVDGVYAFTQLPAGAYDVVVDPTTLPDGFVATFDFDGVSSENEASLILASGQVEETIDFGYRPEADLIVAKTHVGDFAVGAENVWTVVVDNVGPASAQAPVTIADTLPATTTFVTDNSAAWDCAAAGPAVTCTFVDASSGLPIDLPAGASESVDLTVLVGAASAPALTNSATVDSTTADPAPGNNAATDVAEAPLAVLGVTNTLSGDLEAGGDATYSVVVTNYGPSSTSGDVVMTFELPLSMSFDDANSDFADAGCTATGQTVTCTNPGPLAPGESWTIDIDVDVSPFAAGAVLATTASVSGGNLVNGEQLSSSSLDEIYDDVNDPNSNLRGALGISDGPIVNDADVEAALVLGGSAGPLAFTGSTIFRFVALGLMLLIAGAYALWLSSTSRRRPEEGAS